MSDLIRLTWSLNTDPYCELSVFGCDGPNGRLSMQTLAGILYNTRRCTTIRIVSATGNLLEDWITGVMRTSTEVFNDQVRDLHGNA